MMKKLMSMVLSVSVAAVMSVSAFGATNWNPNPGSTQQQNTSPSTVPMYGYVGPVVDDVDDPDPEDPNVTPWKLNISVPVKFMWAAYEPASGLTAPVESPNYKIINHGGKDIAVSIIEFSVTDNPIQSSVGSVDLYLTNVASSLTTPAFNEMLVDTASPSTPIELGTIDKKNGTDTEWLFTIDGLFTADTAWPTTIQLPVYKVVFSFKVDNA